MDMKRDYYEDIQLFRTKTVLVATLLFLAALAALPFWVGDYTLYIVNLIAIHAIVAIGLNILMGYTGQISLGHAGFFAIGAYTCVLLMTKSGVPFFIALPAAGFVSALFGFLLGLPSLRLEGPYLAIATLAFGMAVTQIISHWDFTGGHMGIQAPRMSLGGFVAKTSAQQYAVIMTVTVLLTVAALNLLKTRVGRAFVAIRDSEIAAEAMGINLTWYKTLAFAVSAFYTGIAGALMAFALEHVERGELQLDPLDYLPGHGHRGRSRISDGVDIGGGSAHLPATETPDHPGGARDRASSPGHFEQVFHSGGIAQHSEHRLRGYHDWHRGIRAFRHQRDLSPHKTLLENVAFLGDT